MLLTVSSKFLTTLMNSFSVKLSFSPSFDVPEKFNITGDHIQRQRQKCRFFITYFCCMIITHNRSGM